ncbi:MAG: NADH-quinone oxidoreductase subunit C, partial [Pirellulales bacterium]|nr:NADH-quinone oxidoreductase subunit C [Pirellulales bacterium]
MNAQQIHDLLAKQIPSAVVGGEFEAVDPWIEIKADSLPEVARFLHDQDETAFDMLNCITGVDYFEPDEKKAAKVDWQPHVELLYHLTSLKHKHRLVLKVKLPRWKNEKPGELPEAPSLCDVWRTADWHEREV